MRRQGGKNERHLAIHLLHYRKFVFRGWIGFVDHSKNSIIAMSEKIEKVKALRKNMPGLSLADACLLLGYNVKEIETEELKDDPTVEYLRNIFGMK
jgi:hypothetical protein